MPDSLPSLIAVTGSGEVRAIPDRVTLLVAVRATSNASAEEAAGKAAPVERAVVDALERMGVPREHVSTAAYDAGRERVYVDGETQLREYYVDHVLSVELHDVRTAGDAIRAARAAGATRIGGVHFWLSEEEEYRARATRAAIEQAHTRARAMADAAGVLLGPVVRLGEPEALMTTLGGGSAGGGPPGPLMMEAPLADAGVGNPEPEAVILPVPILVRVTVHGAWGVAGDPH